MSNILTSEQEALVVKAKERIATYKDKISCNDCSLLYVAMLLTVIDDLEFELQQLNK
jgi:hypothetical protein